MAFVLGVVCAFFFPDLVLSFRQTDYVLIPERAEVISFDKAYIKFAKTANFKYNRTNACVNITVNMNRDFGNDLQATVQGYKFASNEYRLFPITFPFNLCTYLTANTFGIGNVYNCGNFARCPMVKGNYHICNWAPDYTQFPPYLPGGRYKSDVKFVYMTKEILHLEAYAEVKPKNKWELKN